MKARLRQNLEEAHLTFDEMYTVLTQIEEVLNLH